MDPAAAPACVLCAAVAGFREYREWNRTRDPRHQETPDLLVRGQWDPILDEATWERVRRVLSDPARKVRRPPRRYLLGGGIVRTLAGEPMVGWPDSAATYSGPGVSIDADRLEAEVLRRMWGWLSRAHRLPVDVDDRAAVDAAETLDALEVELRALARRRTAGQIERIEYEVFAEDVRARMAKARSPPRPEAGAVEPGVAGLPTEASPGGVGPVGRLLGVPPSS